MNNHNIPEVPEHLRNSALYGDDIAPLPPSSRTWSRWNLAALWVGMAVCIPTYLLASYMIKSGLTWYEALIIIGLANVVITLPMVLNGHAGVKYGIPFPVQGRSAFGTLGVHIPSMLRAFVACGWFGVQTWIGGLALYSIWHAVMGTSTMPGLDTGKFIAFGLFWIINIYFIWKGTESIKWLEDYSAPLLIAIGLVLVVWGYRQTGGFASVLSQSDTLGNPTLALSSGDILQIKPLTDEHRLYRAEEMCFWNSSLGNAEAQQWQPIRTSILLNEVPEAIRKEGLSFRKKMENGNYSYSSVIPIPTGSPESGKSIWSYLIWFTAMVGFWATMAISISDITRFSKSQKEQVAGQFIGLPGTMLFYSFVGIFVTSAAVIAFPDILVSENAPWDPVSLMNHFSSPGVIIFAQVCMLIATLSTNIAANVIAPAYAITNLFPRSLSFRSSGVIAGLIGIALCPWWLLDEVSGVLILVSGLLGPVLAVLLCDYFLIRRTQLSIPDLYDTEGMYRYSAGFNWRAIAALLLGAIAAVIGNWVEALSYFYSISWFTGFIVAFLVYFALMKPKSVAMS